MQLLNSDARKFHKMMYFLGSAGIIINFEDDGGFAQLLKSECEKMSDDDDVVLLATDTITILSVLKVHEFREQRFWVWPSLQAKKKYSTTDLIKDLVLDDVDLPNLEYRSGAGFKNFFRMTTTSFETLLSMMDKKLVNVIQE